MHKILNPKSFMPMRAAYISGVREEGSDLVECVYFTESKQRIARVPTIASLMTLNEFAKLVKADTNPAEMDDENKREKELSKTRDLPAGRELSKSDTDVVFDPVDMELDKHLKDKFPVGVTKQTQKLTGKGPGNKNIQESSDDKYGISDYEPYREYLDSIGQEETYEVYTLISYIVETEEDIDFTTALANIYFENDHGRASRQLKRASKKAFNAVIDVAYDIFERKNRLGLRNKNIQESSDDSTYSWRSILRSLTELQISPDEIKQVAMSLNGSEVTEAAEDFSQPERDVETALSAEDENSPNTTQKTEIFSGQPMRNVHAALEVLSGSDDMKSFEKGRKIDIIIHGESVNKVVPTSLINVYDEDGKITASIDAGGKTKKITIGRGNSSFLKKGRESGKLYYLHKVT